ncbi:MAG: hypothetical protein U1B30_02175 [Pseudomonadota bacterium]|nr:hypothetical protein [Pseudomonadota bacterium]
MDSNSRNYQFYVSYKNSNSIKLFESKSKETGLKKFIKENTEDEFELRVIYIPIKTNSPLREIFTAIKEIQEHIEILEKSSKKTKSYRGTLFIIDNGKIIPLKWEIKSICNKETVLQKIIKTYLKTETYEATKTYEKGYEFKYLDSRIFKTAKIIFE